MGQKSRSPSSVESPPVIERLVLNSGISNNEARFRRGTLHVLSLMRTSENNRFSAHSRFDVRNGPLYSFFLMYCLKNDQECIIRFKNTRRNLIIQECEFLNGFKISDMDQLILALIVRFGVILV